MRRSGGGWRSQLSLAVILGGAATACFDRKDYAPTAAGDNALVVQPSAASAPADGASQLRVDLQLPARTGADRRSVALTTTRGTFLESGKAEVTAAVDASGKAHVTLVAPSRAGSATVRASAGTLRREVAVTFDTARATSLEIEPERFALKAAPGEEVKISARLRRQPGQPTAGVNVSFVATTPANDTIGRFGVPTLSDSSGGVQVRYTVGATAYRGPVTITARVAGQQGTGQQSPLSATTRLDIIAP